MKDKKYYNADVKTGNRKYMIHTGFGIGVSGNFRNGPHVTKEQGIEDKSFLAGNAFTDKTSNFGGQAINHMLPSVVNLASYEYYIFITSNECRAVDLPVGKVTNVIKFSGDAE